ncbi:MAG TPA: Na+/H+ antiporter subunit E [Euzebya sp.]|nr:Na+/H+ antiporter subunit E [Euzebya sp.]
MRSRWLPRRRDVVGALARTVGLALMWAALWADLTIGTLVAGLLVAIGVQAVFPSMSPRPIAGRINLLAAVHLAGVFTWMLITANLSVAARVLSPRLSIHPLVVDVDLPPCSDAVATVIANAITLTPGTLTLDIGRHDDGVGLLVHNLDATDPDAVRADVLRLYDLVVAAFPAVAATMEEIA